jgi:hypothetical protein
VTPTTADQPQGRIIGISGRCACAKSGSHTAADEPVRAAVYGFNSAKVERLVAAEPLSVPLTRNHIWAATTKVLARGK